MRNRETTNLRLFKEAVYGTYARVFVLLHESICIVAIDCVY